MFPGIRGQKTRKKNAFTLLGARCAATVISRKAQEGHKYCMRQLPHFCHSASFSWHSVFFFFFCPRVNGAYGCAGYFAVPTCLGTKKWQLNNKLRSSKRLRFVLKCKLCLGPKQLLPVFVIGSKTLEWSVSSLLSTRLMAKHFQLLSKVP